MKNLIVLFIALSPLFSLAGNGDKKDELININISTGKDGNVTITGIKSKDLKRLEKDINNALKDVEIHITNGNEKHTIHLKTELNIE